LISIFIYSIALFFTKPVQTEITVIFNGKQSKLVKFELQLIKDLLNYYAEQKHQRIKIKYKGVKENGSSFDLLDQGNPDQTLVINKLAISKQKLINYDFSAPYIHNYYLLSSRKDYIFNPNVKKVKVGYLRRYKQLVKKLDKSFIKETILYKSSKKAISDLKSRRIDLLLTDYVDLINHDLKVVQALETKVDKLAIMFKKGSKLRVDIDKALEAFKLTKEYTKLVKKHFGNKAESLFGNVLPL